MGKNLIDSFYDLMTTELLDLIYFFDISDISIKRYGTTLLADSTISSTQIIEDLSGRVSRGLFPLSDIGGPEQSIEIQIKADSLTSERARFLNYRFLSTISTSPLQYFKDYTLTLFNDVYKNYLPERRFVNYSISIEFANVDEGLQKDSPQEEKEFHAAHIKRLAQQVNKMHLRFWGETDIGLKLIDTEERTDNDYINFKFLYRGTPSLRGNYDTIVQRTDLIVYGSETLLFEQILVPSTLSDIEMREEYDFFYPL